MAVSKTSSETCTYCFSEVHVFNREMEKLIPTVMVALCSPSKFMMNFEILTSSTSEVHLI